MKNFFTNGGLWLDDNGIHINAHGGGILYHEDLYWWFGEHKTPGTAGNRAYVGVHVYSSPDLREWKDEGVALKVDPETSDSLISAGAIIERPKVLYNKLTRQFVMYFHLEPTGRGYSSAMSGIAVSKNPAGPYSFVRAVRPNQGFWPQNVRPEQMDADSISQALEYPAQIENCSNPYTPNVNILGRDFAVGQQARDMTLFLDDDGKAYHIYSSEHNSTLHIAELTPDFLDYSGRYWRAFEHRWMEAPVIFKNKGRYFMIASDCTGWAPNAPRLAVANHITGPWRELDNPARGNTEQQNTTFRSQGTFALQLDDANIIFMADRWNPADAIDGRYIWLPIRFEHDLPYLEWQESPYPENVQCMSELAG